MDVKKTTFPHICISKGFELMSRAGGLLLIALAWGVASPALAAVFTFDATIDANTSTLTIGYENDVNLDWYYLTPGYYNQFMVGTTTPESGIYKGTYPDTSNLIEPLNYGGIITFGSLSGITTETISPVAGDYFLYVYPRMASSTMEIEYGERNSNQFVICYTTPTGTSDWSIEPCVGTLNPETGSEDTHVVGITSPTLYQTVASTTLNIAFSYVNNQEHDTANGYKITVRHTLTGAFRQFTDYLTSTSTPDGTESISIQTPTEGTYEVRVDLCLLENGGNAIACVNKPQNTYFNAVVADNVQVVEDSGYTIVTYPPESCEIDFTNFNFGDCMGYLLIPGRETMQKFSTFSLQNYAPWSYPEQVMGAVGSLFMGNSNGSNGMTVHTEAWGDITIVNQQMIAAIPFVPLLKTLLIAGIWFMAGFALYRKGLTVFDQKTV